MSALKEKYKDEIKAKLQEKFVYENPMQIPGLRKVVINMGIAEASKDKGILQDHIEELKVISGQKPVVTKARKSIAGFKLRDGMPIGMMVTLRGQRMYDFVYRFINVVAPRIRDFRGFQRKGDGSGNYTIGLDDQQVFPEVDLDKVKRQQGMHITFVTSARTDDECRQLLVLMGLPIKDETTNQRALG